jgi:diguanylate cyclase (GGDEF)-like protein/PAS domain S-box-containing protein
VAENVITGQPSSHGPNTAGRSASDVRTRVTAGRLASYAAALQEGLRLYQTVFERSSLGQFIVDFPSFRIDVVNKAFSAMTGFSIDELVGSDIGLVFPPDESPANDVIERLAADRAIEGYTVQRFLQRRDGTILPALATVSVIRDDDGWPIQLIVLLQDRSQQRAAEEAQRRSQALIDAAIATLPMTFTAFDTDLRFTYVAGGLQQPGTQPEKFLGKSVTEFSKHRPTLLAMRRALKGDESTTRTLFNGQTYLTLHGPMRNDSGAVVGVIAVSTNVTAEVTAEAVRRQAEELRLFVAQHDDLTGLAGRSALVEHLNTLAWSERGPGALLLLDLDDFKLINEGLGHEVGDAVILAVASRVSDTFPGLFIARNGGDEFAVVFPSDMDQTSALEGAERVRAALDVDITASGHVLRVTACVGVAIKQVRGSTSTLIGNADSALSRAKDAGIGQYRLYDAEMRRQVEDRLVIQGGLRLALRLGHLRIAYQPVFSLVDRRMIGSEALLRWTHPERGPISPAEFIPIAEQSGIIVPMGQWVMNTACADMLSLQRDHGMDVSVNVSVRQLIDGDFAEWVEEILERTELPPYALTVEVTESALMDDIGTIRTAFDRLRARGVKVAIDDFGTGYSSLARLQSLPVDVIKLDRAFVTGVDMRAEARNMAAAILQLSAAIGADMIAEGVETEAEATTLRELGYTAAQGFLFAAPMPVEELRARLCAESALAKSAGLRIA